MKKFYLYFLFFTFCFLNASNTRIDTVFASSSNWIKHSLVRNSDNSIVSSLFAFNSSGVLVVKLDKLGNKDAFNSLLKEAIGWAQCSEDPVRELPVAKCIAIQPKLYSSAELSVSDLMTVTELGFKREQIKGIEYFVKDI